MCWRCSGRDAPAHADPADPEAAFVEYADTSRAEWVAAHLLQLAGLAGVVLAVVLLAGAVAGVGLKVAVNLCSTAPAAEQPALFAAAQAVRGIEVGLDGVFALLLAATIAGLAAVHLTAPRGSWALGALAATGAGVGAAGGVLFCLQGFSAAAMDVALAGLALGLVAVAVLATAVRCLRQGVEP